MAYDETRQERERRHSRRDLLTIGLITILVLAIGTLFYHFVEGMRPIDAIYFSVITLTTVGYGDLIPQTELGKLFTAGYVIIGIGIIATFARVLLQSTLARRLRHEDKNNKSWEIEEGCPRAGRSQHRDTPLLRR